MRDSDKRSGRKVPRKTFRVVCQTCSGQGSRLVMRMAASDVYPPLQQLRCAVCDGEGRVNLVFEFPGAGR